MAITHDSGQRFEARSRRREARRLSTSELLRTAALALVLAVGLNLLVLGAFELLFEIDPDFFPMTIPPVAGMTALQTVLAFGVFAVIQRVSARPVRVFQIVALVALILSFIPDLVLPALDTGPQRLQDADGPSTVALIIMHIVAAAVIVGLITRRATR